MIRYLTLSLLIVINLTTKIPDYYHTTEQINEEIDLLLQSCKATKTVHEQDPYIYSLNFKQQNYYHKKNALIVFGEHARELISAETGLKLVKNLCNQDEPQIQEVLKQYNINILINLNPNSRKYVEQGHSCLRENQNGVDLNRNYDVEWQHVVDHDQQTSSGDYPFSEIETKIVEQMMNSLQPHVYLSIHSGALAILNPYAYQYKSCEDEKIEQISSELGSKYCRDCDVGSGANTIGYAAAGTSMDYAYMVAQIPYSYTFEIYEQNRYENLVQQDITINKKHHHHKNHNLNQKPQHKRHEEPSSNFGEFIQARDNNKLDQFLDNPMCFYFFNPSTNEDYIKTTTQWSNNIIETLQLITQYDK